MAVSRIDILNREFTRSLRGYNPEEVDNFLHDVADTLGRLGDEKVVLSSRVVQLEARLAEFEQQEAALRNTLLATQRMTEDLKSSAQREAQLIIDAARSRADNLLQQANQRLTRIFDEIAEAKKLKTQFEISVRSVVESHLKLLDMQRENEARLDAGVARLGFNNNYTPQYQPSSRQDYYSPNEQAGSVQNQAPQHNPAQGTNLTEQRNQTQPPQANGQPKAPAGTQAQASGGAPSSNPGSNPGGHGSNQANNQGQNAGQNPGAAQTHGHPAMQTGTPPETPAGESQEQSEQEILVLQKVEDPLELGAPGKGERYRG